MYSRVIEMGSFATLPGARDYSIVKVLLAVLKNSMQRDRR
jgi:hypothetical protein